MSAIPYISNRFALSRFLGLTAEEIAENERLWREENDEMLGQTAADPAGEMRSVGISSAGISADLDGGEDLLTGDEEPEVGGDTAPPETSTGTDLGGTPAGAPTEQTI